jgi:hypothetical protein
MKSQDATVILFLCFDLHDMYITLQIKLGNSILLILS